MLREDGRDQAPITGRLCAPTDNQALDMLILKEAARPN